MDKDQEIDVIICTLIDEDADVIYSVKTGVDKIPELQLLKDLTWMAYGDCHGINNLTDYLQDLLIDSKTYSIDFPYQAFKDAKNPKVITIYT